MIADQTVEFPDAVTLLGGGAADADRLRAALTLAGRLVAADGGANMAAAEGLMPDLVIGDFDSATAEALRRIPADRQMRIVEQDSTDFEKCLARITAPFILGLGFLGPRIDHTLAVFSALIGHAEKLCVLVGEEDIVFAAPPELALDLPVGTRFSLYPLVAVRASGRGLRWPVDGLDLAPDAIIATSNEVAGPVRLQLDRPGLLAILPAGTLAPVLRALRSGPRWPKPRGR